MSTREIVLDGGSPWGFRMHGGADVGQPLRISRVNPGSKAAQRGVREGDVISSINGQSTRNISNSDAHALLRNAGETLHLGLNEECSGSPKRRLHRNPQQELKTESVKRSTVTKTVTTTVRTVNGAADPDCNTQNLAKGEGVQKEASTPDQSKGQRRRRRQQNSPAEGANMRSTTPQEGTETKTRRRRRSRGANRRKCRVGTAETDVSGSEHRTESQEASVTETETDAGLSDVGGRKEDVQSGSGNEVVALEPSEAKVNVSDNSTSLNISEKIGLCVGEVGEVAELSNGFFNDAEQKSVRGIEQNSENEVTSSSLEQVKQQTHREGNSTSEVDISSNFATEAETIKNREVSLVSLSDSEKVEHRETKINETETSTFEVEISSKVDADIGNKVFSEVEQILKDEVLSSFQEEVEQKTECETLLKDVKQFENSSSEVNVSSNCSMKIDQKLHDATHRRSKMSFEREEVKQNMGHGSEIEVLGSANVDDIAKWKSNFDEEIEPKVDSERKLVSVVECSPNVWVASERRHFMEASLKALETSEQNKDANNISENFVKLDCQPTNSDIENSGHDISSTFTNKESDHEIVENSELPAVDSLSVVCVEHGEKEETSQNVRKVNDLMGVETSEAASVVEMQETQPYVEVAHQDVAISSSDDVIKNNPEEFLHESSLHLENTRRIDVPDTSYLPDADVPFIDSDGDHVIVDSYEAVEFGFSETTDESLVLQVDINDRVVTAKVTSCRVEDRQVASSENEEFDPKLNRGGECFNSLTICEQNVDKSIEIMEPLDKQCDLGAENAKQFTPKSAYESLEKRTENVDGQGETDVNNEAKGFKISESNSDESKERLKESIDGSTVAASESEDEFESASSTETVLQCRAVVVEEEIWEEVEEMTQEELAVGTSSLLSEEDRALLDPHPLIEAEEEENLRRFLHSLNLADSKKEVRKEPIEEVYATRRGKRRETAAVASNQPQQRSLEVILEENSSDYSDGEKGARVRGHGWQQAVYIPEINEVVLLSSDEGDYEARVRDVFSEDMEDVLERAGVAEECDSEEGGRVELADSSDDEDRGAWRRGRARERQHGVEIVYLEDDSASTSSGSCIIGRREDDPDLVYEGDRTGELYRADIDPADVIYENVEFRSNGGVRSSTLTSSVYENVEFVRGATRQDDRPERTCGLHQEKFNSAAQRIVLDAAIDEAIVCTDAQTYNSSAKGGSEVNVTPNLSEVGLSTKKNVIKEELSEINSKTIDPKNLPEKNIDVNKPEVKVVNISERNIDTSNTSVRSIDTTRTPERNFDINNAPEINIDTKNVSEKIVDINKSEIEVSKITEGNIDTNNTPETNIDTTETSERNVDINNVPEINIDTKNVPESIIDINKSEIEVNILETNIDINNTPEVVIGTTRTSERNANINNTQKINIDTKNLSGPNIDVTNTSQRNIDTTNVSECSIDINVDSNNISEINIDISNISERKEQQDVDTGQLDSNTGDVNKDVSLRDDAKQQTNVYKHDTSQGSIDTDLTLQKSKKNIPHKSIDTRTVDFVKKILFLMPHKENIDTKQLESIVAHLASDEDELTPTNRSRHESSSSDAGSHGTAFYCPMGFSPLSSDADISSYAEDTSIETRTLRVTSQRDHLKTLRELAVERVMSLPYGADILHLLGFAVRTPRPSQGTDQWVGMPTKEDPNVLVYLSPSQRQTYHEGGTPTPEEAETLLDLHRKFVQRRGYHENVPPPPPSRKFYRREESYVNSPTLLQAAPSRSGNLEASPTLTSQDSKIPREGEGSRLLAILRSEVDPPPVPPLPHAMLGCHHFDLLKAPFCFSHNPADMPAHKKRVPYCFSQTFDTLDGPYVKAIPNDVPSLSNQNGKLENWACSLDSPPIKSKYANKPSVRQNVKADRPPYCVTQRSNTLDSPALKTKYVDKPSGRQNVASDRPPYCVTQRSNSLDNPSLRMKDGSLSSPPYQTRKKERAPSWYGQDISDTERLKVTSLSDWLQIVRRGSSEGARSQDSTPRCLSTQSSPGTTRRATERQQNGGETQQNPNRLKQDILERRLSLQECQPARDAQRREQQLKLLHQHQEQNKEPEGRKFDADKYRVSKQGDIAVINSSGKNSKRRPQSMPPVTGGEIFRQQMYLEYMHKVAERKERRRHKVIRLSSVPRDDAAVATAQQLENEFMGRVRQRMDKLGIRYDEESDDAGDAELPKHLQEFLVLPDSDVGSDVDGVWSPSQKPSSAPVTELPNNKEQQQDKKKEGDDAHPVVWTPKSAGASPTTERKEFRPVSFESPTLPRKNRSATSTPAPAKPAEDYLPAVTTSSESVTSFSSIFSPWQQQQSRDDSTISIGSTVQSPTSEASSTVASNLDRRLVQSQSAPASGLSALASGASTSTKLPRAQNPTITLLQKAREGQLPRGALYLDHKMNSKQGEKPYVSPNEILYTVKKEYESPAENEERRKKIVELGPRKFEGIGPITKEGIPIVLRSEVKDANQAKWYKRMYDSLHRAGKDDDYVTVRYKPRRGHYPYTSPGGYLSEPEPGCYDSDIGYSAKYATLDRRRIKNKENDFTTSTLPRSRYVPHPNSIKYATEVYKNQPGRIEDYVPGHSSISEKETKQWWDEVLDIFDGQGGAEPHTTPSTPSNKPFMTYALKESGYESDSTLVFKRRDENLQSQLSPAEQKLAYKSIQKGGEVPLHGLRKAAPERPKESPHRYVESEVTIHYRSPVRSEAKEALSEEELARRQAEAMRRIYQEERRRKYLQELQDMHSRRHTDNFTPSQKSPIPLNRYDDFLHDVGNKSKSRDRTPEPKLVARALYNFVGQTSRELSFRRGDIIFVRRQVDKNWYEGEHNAMVGLFPFNYVEIIPYDGIRTIPKRPSEGQARAKFNFIAQTHLELSLVKGELVVLTRRVDDNWFEGRIGNRKGIFPVSYVEILSEPGEKPVTTPASHTVLVNGSGVKQQHGYQPSYYNKMPSSFTSSNPYATLPRQSQTSKQPVNQTLHIDTHSDPVPYRALYNYRPQNEDELELSEGDTVYVMEKCDDGWYVGSSQRTGYFGTFPGNYVERI